MGGKNKKHKGGGAGAGAVHAAVSAATAAARAKAAAESGAAGEAAGKRPAVRPALVSKEPRVKQGPKTYSFGSTPDSSAAANLDKSILKVVINSNLEKRIIGVINEHKKQSDDKGMISRRLTAKKLQDVYMALQGFSFKTEDIEEAMKNTILYGGDLHSALDWLCLNLSDDALPEGFSQQFEEEQHKPRAKFRSPVPQSETPQIPNNRKDDGPEIKRHTAKDKEMSMKEWILQYAEQQSDDEKSESVKNTEDEEKFDPNERYVHLATKLLEAKEQASSSKQDKDKQSQKVAQEKIRRIQHVKKREPRDVRNFDYTARSWTGKSPKQFLIDWCRKNFPKSPNPSFEKVPVGRYWKCRVKVTKSVDVMAVCPTIVTEDSMQAQHLAATLALYHLVKGQDLGKLIIP